MEERGHPFCFHCEGGEKPTSEAGKGGGDLKRGEDEKFWCGRQWLYQDDLVAQSARVRSENRGCVRAAQLCRPLQRAAPLCEYQVHLILSMFSKGPGSSRLRAFDHTSRTRQADFCFSSRALEMAAEGGGGSEGRLSSLLGLCAFHSKFCACSETYRKRREEKITTIPLCTEVCSLKTSPRISDRF